MNSLNKRKLTPGEFFKEYGIIVVFFGLIAVFTAFKPVFIMPENLLDIFRQVSFTGIISVGMTFVMLTGGIDLTVGSVVGLSSCICAMVMAAAPIPFAEGTMNPNAVLGIAAGLSAGTSIGLVNAFFINQIKIPGLIVTLAMMEMVRGFVLIITNAMPIFEGITPDFVFLGQGNVAGIIPFPAIVLVCVFVIGGIILSKTVYGRKIYCVGGNSEVARLSGINVKKISYSVYIISAFLASVAAILLTARSNSGQPRSAGLGYEFQVITACVFGGISIAGGEGNLRGVFFGVLVMGVLFNGLIQFGLSDFYQQVIKGAVLLIAVSIDAISQNKKTNLLELRNTIKEKRSEAA